MRLYGRILYRRRARLCNRVRDNRTHCNIQLRGVCGWAPGRCGSTEGRGCLLT